jgi:hypothetical protein
MFASFHCGLEMHGTKARWGGQQHHIDAALQHLAVRVQPDKPPLLRHGEVVMQARLPPQQGIAAMQAINVAVLNRWFFGVFFGTAAGCLLLVVLSLLKWQSPGSIYRLIGSALYLAGTILVTGVCNIPRNNALATVDAGRADGARAPARDRARGIGR